MTRPDPVNELLNALSLRLTSRLRSAYLQAAFSRLNVHRDVRARIELAGGGLTVRVRGASRDAAPHIRRFVADVLGPAEFRLEARL